MWSEVVCERSGNTASVDKMSVISNCRERENIQTSSVLCFLPKAYRTRPACQAGAKWRVDFSNYDRSLRMGATKQRAGTSCLRAVSQTAVTGGLILSLNA